MAKLPGAIQGARIVGQRYVRAQRRQNPEGRMPLFDHLRELRNRIVKMALALIAGMTVGFVFFTPVWHVIERPLCHAVIRGETGCTTLGVNQLVLNGPLDAFYLRVKVALIVGVIVSRRCGCTRSGRSSRRGCTRGRSGGGTSSSAP